MCRNTTKKIIWLLMVIDVIEIYSAKAEKYDWSTCNQYVRGCNCKWVNGKKQANCENANLEDVPTKLSDDIQDLILDHNSIPVLRNEVFKTHGLINLQKISLRNCKIGEIEKNAFRGLALVIEIDLSDNMIHRLDTTTFSDTVRLRALHMSNNFVEKLNDGLFPNLVYLQIIDLNDNRISQIGYKTFANLTSLTNLKLNNNQLSYVKLSMFESLSKLSSLEVKNNPWKCDCRLRNFVTWFYTHNLYTHPTACAEPGYLRTSNWNSIKPEEFACKPEILWPNPETIIETNGEKLTLSCKVSGDPKPETYWIFNSRVINNDTSIGWTSIDHKYTDFESAGNVFWYNVTISKINRQDHGTYSCVAKNPAGSAERNVSVSMQSGQIQIFGISRTNVGDIWVLLLCLFIGIICALILIFMLCFLCCRRDKTVITKEPPNNSIIANGDIIHHIVMESEQQKTLLTAVNPVQKPPRKYDSSPYSDNDGTEMTELNRNLLDNTSVQDGTSITGDSIDDRRSINSIEQLSSCNSQDNLLLRGRLKPTMRSHQPPDLLAFPNYYRMQESPANSSMSNDPDNTHLRTIHSPVRSPIYQVHSYTPSYEILSSSRTQSPYLTPVISQREGYVTIPRQPRVPSWFSVPTPTIENTMFEPTYDNLGKRTTADGSSGSLPRKLSSSSSSNIPFSNIRTRTLPSYSHTLPHKSKLNQGYVSAQKAENTDIVRLSPLSSSSPSNKSVLHIRSENKRNSWVATHAPENDNSKKIFDTSETLTDANTLGKCKVPPKPPPKPNKHGPLFEDEGEDGTEV